MPMDMYGNEPEISGPQKAAILLISLGPEYSAMLFKHLTDEEIEKLTLEIANQKQVEPELKQSVISEFYQMAMAKSYLSSGGLQYARNVLEKALGSEKASVIISRLTTSLQVRPFDFLHNRSIPAFELHSERASTDHCSDYGLSGSRSGSNYSVFLATGPSCRGIKAYCGNGPHFTRCTS